MVKFKVILLVPAVAVTTCIIEKLCQVRPEAPITLVRYLRVATTEELCFKVRSTTVKLQSWVSPSPSPRISIFCPAVKPGMLIVKESSAVITPGRETE